MIPQFENNPGSWFPPVIGDTTSKVVARIIRDRPRVTVQKLGPTGVVKFSMNYRELNLSPLDIQKMDFLSYQILADFIGGFLLQTNIDLFLDLITECNFEHHVRTGKVSHFRLSYDATQLFFECKICLLYYALNEVLAKTLEGEQASVALRWDFLHRSPKNKTFES